MYFAVCAGWEWVEGQLDAADEQRRQVNRILDACACAAVLQSWRRLRWFDVVRDFRRDCSARHWSYVSQSLLLCDNRVWRNDVFDLVLDRILKVSWRRWSENELRRRKALKGTTDRSSQNTSDHSSTFPFLLNFRMFWNFCCRFQWMYIVPFFLIMMFANSADPSAQGRSWCCHSWGLFCHKHFIFLRQGQFKLSHTFVWKLGVFNDY